MPIVIARRSIAVMICIAINTAIFACVVHTDIDTCHAATFFPLIGVFAQIKLLPEQSFKKAAIYTMTVRNTKLFKIDTFRAGFYSQMVFAGYISESHSKFLHFFIFERPQINAFHVRSCVSVQIQEADNALARKAG